MKVRPSQGADMRPNILAYIGASGAGKSTSLKAHFKAARHTRSIIFDTQHEYDMYGAVTHTLADVHRMLMEAGRGPVAIVFRPSADMKVARQQFDAICRMAHAAGHIALVAEELAFVTRPSGGEPGWMLVNLRGRLKGLVVYGTTQRPARVDKDFFGNATRIRCGRLNYATDQRVMADVLGVPVELIQELKPMEYIERDMTTGKVVTGEVTVGAIQPPAREFHMGDVGKVAKVAVSGASVRKKGGGAG